MIIVDTSVWSYALRRNSPPDNGQLDKLASALKQAQPIALLGVILQEVLQGIRDPHVSDRVRTYLEVFPLIALERQDYVAAAELWNVCARKGFRASTVDFQVAAACIRHDCVLLTNDNDFERISQHCPLRLL